MLKKLCRYFHTIRYLKLSQILWRLWYRVYYPRVSTELPSIVVVKPVHQWHQSILRKRRFFEEGKLWFLNKSVSCGETLWANADQQSKLWRYNLHYFEVLSSDKETDRAQACELIGEWLEQFPMGAEDAWEPYPISLRIVYWIKYVLNGGELSDRALDSLYQQARYLAKIPEYHILGNHLFENAKALVFAGTFFKGEEAKRWQKLGFKILKKQIPEQILSDGGHFELSPMYHSIILEGMLDLYNLSLAYGMNFHTTQAFRIQKMRFWLKTMCHPDGDISFFNDAAFDIAAHPSQIEVYAEQLGLEAVKEPSEGITHLKASGYVRMQKGHFVAILDCANIGPDYLPGHAHADTLSFELSVNGQRVIVNSGTSVYGEDPELRAWQRSTAAHSTVEINGRNSSDVWGCFRVGRRVRPYDLVISNTHVECCYMTLDGVKHTRRWCCDGEQFDLTDHVSEPVKAKSRLYFAPGVEFKQFSWESSHHWETTQGKHFSAFDKVEDSALLVHTLPHSSEGIYAISSQLRCG